MSYFVLGAIILIILIILIIVIQPFKDTSYYSITITFLIILLLVDSSILGNQMAFLKQYSLANYFIIFGTVVYAIPFLYMTVISLYWAWKQRELVSAIIRRVQAWKKGYEPLAAEVA